MARAEETSCQRIWAHHDDQDAQFKLNNVRKQPGQQIWQYIKDIDNIIEYMSDKPDSQIKAAFI